MGSEMCIRDRSYFHSTSQSAGWPPGQSQPAPFAALQRRLGRKAPGRQLLAECPAAFVAYDLLEWQGVDIRGWPLSRRRAALEALLQQVLQTTAGPAAGVPGASAVTAEDAQPPKGAEPFQAWSDADPGGEPPSPAPALTLSEASVSDAAECPLNPHGVLEAPSDPLRPLPGAAASEARLRLSPARPLESWQELEQLRQTAAAAVAEGVMLKRLASPYLAGRRRGAWWKHKRDPYSLDAVLLYAQAGSGRRANLFTDYTFGLWNGEGVLVSFAKAYSGLDDGEILELDRWIRSHTTERFGPVRAVQPLQVFELAFEGLQRSARHKSGIAVRFPRISRWRRDKPAAEADTLAAALALLSRSAGSSEEPGR